RGNNAGDGYVLARLAVERGIAVLVREIDSSKPPAGDAGEARARALEAGIRPEPMAGDGIGDADVIIDGIFGTGLDRPVEGRWREAIEQVNESVAPVLALDIPSGLHADTGAVMGVAVRAAACISFIGLKRGLFTARGPDVAGEVHFDDLGVPPHIHERVTADAYLDRLNAFSGLLGPRPRDAHKGRFGHLLVVGGEQGYAGAARLAAEAALRCGAGLVSIATRRAHAHVINAGRYEIMARGVERGPELAPQLEQATVVVAGPGLGRSEWSQELLGAVLEAGKPTVLDADALNLVAELKPSLPASAVMTPHPGEAGRLLGSDAAGVESDRFAAVADLTARFGRVCVLKGAGSLTAGTGEPAFVCAHGNPGMASGGMGDVLSGVIGALMAQGLDAESAARAGVCVHARAGDLAAAGGERGTLASDLMPHLRDLINVL
ncbi:MAG: NAD(P)H-hydrate dehydratase, partial [Gammaproteobacteria bacterium]|nr:NAD(P)H-hydrate dehydratase [Gammaproteobacteria bacterium]